MKLVTPGQIKAELRRLYSDVARSRVDSSTAYLMKEILRLMLRACEVEHTFRLAEEDPEADIPVFTGLVMVGPKCRGDRCGITGENPGPFT